jgi:hypothetical protein
MTFNELREELARAQKDAVLAYEKKHGKFPGNLLDFEVNLTAEAVKCIRDMGGMPDPEEQYYIGFNKIIHKDSDTIEYVLKGDTE